LCGKRSRLRQVGATGNLRKAAMRDPPIVRESVWRNIVRGANAAEAIQLCLADCVAALADLKFLKWTRGKLSRNFKSAALVPHDFAVRECDRWSADTTRVHRIPHSAFHDDSEYAPLGRGGTRPIDKAVSAAR
jgi:hypothetical protein